MRARSARIALTAVLTVELALGLVAVVTMIPTYPAAGAERDVFAPLWVSLLVSAILSCVWVAATLLGAVRRKGSWVRGSAVTIHVLMLAAAFAVFQGVIGTPAIGALLLVLALVGLASAVFVGLPASQRKPAGDAGLAQQAVERPE
ncbi:hypothetical protein [Leucobacter albus]